MPADPNDNLHEVLKSVRTRPLFVIRLDVRKLQVVGETPGSYRRVGVVFGGAFEGERLSGGVLNGGSDWQTVRRDGATTLDVRLILKTNDDAPDQHGLPRTTPRATRNHRAHRKGRSGRSHDALFPYCAPLRDRRSEIRLDQPHHRRRDRPSRSRWRGLQRVRSTVIRVAPNSSGPSNEISS